MPRLKAREVVAGTAMMPLSRIADRAYPVSRDADSRREEEARQTPIEATVVEARPANWFAVRVEIVSGDPSRGPSRPPPAPSENGLYERPRPLPAPIEAPMPSAPQASAAMMPATEAATAVVADRLGRGEMSRALAAYGAQMRSGENSQLARANQRLSVRA